jgi:hypothetical protein
VKYTLEMTEQRTIGSEVLRVEVTQGGEGLNGPRLELRSGAWLGDFNKPTLALAGDKDAVGEPGVVEFVNVKRGMFLLGVEVQPERLVHIPLSLFVIGFYVLRIDLTAPWETVGDQVDGDVD